MTVQTDHAGQPSLITEQLSTANSHLIRREKEVHTMQDINTHNVYMYTHTWGYKLYTAMHNNLT